MHIGEMANFYIDATFYAEVLFAVLACRAANRWLPRGWRQAALIGLSLIFLLQLRNAQVFLPILLVYVGAVIGLAEMLRRRPAGAARRLVFAGGLAFCLLVLMAFKYPTYTSAVLGTREWIERVSTIEWVGLSYLTFRALDLLIMVRAGRVKSFRPLDVAAYLLFFAPMVAGPINRFQPFMADQAEADAPMTADRLRNNLLRISAGVIKVLFLAKVAYYNSIIAPEFEMLGDPGRLRLVIGVYAYFLYIYIDFSGYCDCAIAVADFFGIRVPENFRWPVIAGSIQDFWNRWHISLSHWCRDHIFFPLLMFMSTRAAWVPRIVSSSIAIFVTFAIIGAWHGDALHWLLYGCYHGLGLVALSLYNHALRAYAPRLGERLQGHPVYRVAAIVATFNFVSWGLLLTVDGERLDRILHGATPVRIDAAPGPGPGSLEVIPDAEAETVIVVGGGGWDRLGDPAAGWPVLPNRLYRGRLDLDLVGSGEARIHALQYDRRGRLIDDRVLGAARPTIPFAFSLSTHPAADHLTIGVTIAAGQEIDIVRIHRLVLEQIE